MRFDVEKLRGSLTVADGSWSTTLQARGYAHTRPAELANIEAPDVVRQLAREYIQAGAAVLTTNTFGASRFNFDRRHVRANPSQVARLGVELAVEARQDAAVSIAGTIGASGKMLAAHEATPEQLAEVFAEHARALATAGADAILLETFSELEELLVAIRAVRSVTDLPLIASMSYESGPQRTRTIMGTPAESATAALDRAGADVIGCNCGGGIAHALPALVAVRAATQRPVWVKPSIGLPDVEEGRPVYHADADEFMSYVGPLLDVGADIIGGCCGVGPELIKRLSLFVEGRKQKVARR